MLKRILGFPLFTMIQLSEWIALKSWYHLGFIPPQTAVFPWLITVILIILTGIDASGLFYISLLGFFIIVELFAYKHREFDGVVINPMRFLPAQHSLYFYFFSISYLICLLFLPLFPDVFFGQLAILILHVQVGGKGGTLWEKIKVPSAAKARLMPS